MGSSAKNGRRQSLALDELQGKRVQGDLREKREAARPWGGHKQVSCHSSSLAVLEMDDSYGPRHKPIIIIFHFIGELLIAFKFYT